MRRHVACICAGTPSQEGAPPDRRSPTSTQLALLAARGAARAAMLSRFRCQCLALAHKNYLLMRRRRRETCLELLSPALVIIILGLTDLSYRVTPPEPRAEELLSMESDGVPVGISAPTCRHRF